ncbi:MAG: TIGR03084 family metal-binding protein [Myxococcota bacterium]
MSFEIGQNLLAETVELGDFLKTLEDEDWSRETLFMDWTPWDVVAHLHFFDEVSIASLAGPEAFAVAQKRVVEGMVAGRTGQEMARESLGQYNFTDLLERWQKTNAAMVEELGASDPKRRLPWFGPDMGVQMFTTARFMETWAHGQAIYDLKKVAREPTDRLKNIVAIGIKTFGWTFVNRKLEIPGPPPHVRLVAPSGEIWEYNDPSESERIEGTAVDFCMTVTQVRNVADTDLHVTGDVSKRWMEIAQCFAGGPVDPPKPGYRLGA